MVSKLAPSHPGSNPERSCALNHERVGVSGFPPKYVSAAPRSLGHALRPADDDKAGRERLAAAQIPFKVLGMDHDVRTTETMVRPTTRPDHSGR